jgi:hypothetical protein
MPHIQLPEGLPGITSALAFRPETAKPLLALAEELLRGPNSLTSGERENVTAEDVAAARGHGATDREIHDTVLIAAAFCMYNRYVDGPATFTPVDPKLYDEMGARMATQGYGGAR